MKGHPKDILCLGCYVHLQLNESQSALKRASHFKAICTLLMLYMLVYFVFYSYSCVLHAAFAKVVFVWSYVVCSKHPSLEVCFICQLYCLTIIYSVGIIAICLLNCKYWHSLQQKFLKDGHSSPLIRADLLRYSSKRKQVLIWI